MREHPFVLPGGAKPAANAPLMGRRRRWRVAWIWAIDHSSGVGTKMQMLRVIKGYVGFFSLFPALIPGLVGERSVGL